MSDYKIPGVGKDEYTVRVLCQNCMHEGTVNLPKGVRAEEGLEHETCRNCGCKKVLKKYKPQY